MTDDPATAAPHGQPTREESAPADDQTTEPTVAADAQPLTQEASSALPAEAAPEASPPAQPEPTPEAEAGVEAVLAPDPQGAPESPVPPAEVAAEEAEAARVEAEGEAEPVAETETPEPEVAEPVALAAPESPGEEEPLAEPEAEAAAEVSAEAEAVPAEAAPPEPEAKPKKSRKKAAPARAAAEEEYQGEEAAPAEGEPSSAEEPAPENKKKWYAIKVQSGREDTIKAAILRKVAIEGLEEFVGQIVIPVEEVIEKKAVRVKDKKTGEYTTQEKKVTKKRKKFHGYIFAELEFNERTLFLIRETSGVGDFLNMRGKPPVPEPMPEHEVQSMLTGVAVKDPTKKVKFKLDFEKGDKVRIREGSFANSEGEVKAITEAKDPTETPKVTVVLTFWGRPLDVELDATQVDKV